VVELAVLLRQVDVWKFVCLSDRLCHNAGHFNAYEGIQAGSVGCVIAVHMQPVFIVKFGSAAVGSSLRKHWGWVIEGRQVSG
jgi:hypothetical protein